MFLRRAYEGGTQNHKGAAQEYKGNGQEYGRALRE